MVPGSDLTLNIILDEIPILNEAREMYERGVSTGVNRNNRRMVEKYWKFPKGSAPMLQELMLDPQTSGGLLVAVPEDETIPILKDLHNVGVFTSACIGYVSNFSEAKLIFLEDQEQLDKVTKVWDRLPSVTKIIVFDAYAPKDMTNVISFKEFIENAIDDDSFEKCIEKSYPSDVISFIYTSGTTGNPKAGVITNANVISSIKHLPKILDISQKDLTIAYLPLAHIAERLLGHFLKLVCGNQTAFAESIEAVSYTHLTLPTNREV